MGDPHPLIPIRIDPTEGGRWRVTAGEAVLADAAKFPVQAARRALAILGYGPACLVQFTLPIRDITEEYEVAPA